MARYTWDQLIAPEQLEVPHNCYLKLFVMDMQRTRKVLRSTSGRPYDVILVDEAQARRDGVVACTVVGQSATVASEELQIVREGRSLHCFKLNALMVTLLAQGGLGNMYHAF